MTEMNVVHVVPALFGRAGTTGGAERYAFELARHMAPVVPTTLVTFGPEDREDVHDALQVRVIGRPWLVRGQPANPLSLRLPGALAQSSVVHCHQQYVAASSFAAAYARLTGRKVFATDLGGGGFDISSFISTNAWYHGHLHISRYSRAVHGHAGNPRAHVISGGVDTAKFSPASPPPPGPGAVLFVGRILPHKGVDYLVEGLPGGARLDVVGPAADAAFLGRLRALARGKQVTFSHHLDDAALAAAYQRALCVVLPSVYRASTGSETVVPELLGQTLLEGMASGIPAICSNVASMPELVEDGITGFVVPPNDAGALGEKITWLLEHPAERRQMGAAARRRMLERFGWPDVVRRCLEIYAA